MRGVGIDIVDNKRIRKNMDKLYKLILSETEQSIFDTLVPDKAVAFLSGRFAAKEAIINFYQGWIIQECKILLFIMTH